MPIIEPKEKTYAFDAQTPPLYTVKQGEKRNQPSYITVELLSYGRLYRVTNSFP